MKANRFKCYIDMYYPSELPAILERETEDEMKKYKKRLIEHVRKEIEDHNYGKNVDANEICKYIEEFDQPKRIVSEIDPYGEENWDDAPTKVSYEKYTLKEHKKLRQNQAGLLE
jgi:hypothetical protein